MEYPSLAHRLIDYYRSTMPAFTPIESDKTDGLQQEQMHSFLMSVCDTLSSDPGIIGLPEIQDGHFGWHQMYKCNPQLKKDIQSSVKKILRLYEVLMSLGLLGESVGSTLVVPTKEAKITPQKAKLLNGLGLDTVCTKDETKLSHPQYLALPQGWKLLSEAVSGDAKTAVFFFSRGIFSPSPAILLQVFGEKLGDGEALNDYIAFLRQRGFSSELDLSADGIELNVRYKKELRGTHRPLGGFYLTANVLRGNQPACCIDLVESLKFMQRYPEMDAELRGFVFNKSRVCNGCGYCIQTNKKQTVKAVRMEHNGEAVMKCPFFLGTRWTRLDADLVSLMKKAIAFDEMVVAG